MLLGDLGADVIKVEQPGTGDFSRGWYPAAKGESSTFLALNRNKRSVTLNLKSTDAREILYKLVETSDVLITNFRAKALENMGASYELVKKSNPKIIYCSLSGFGEGPYGDRPAYDPVLQGMGGFMSITGEPNRPPVRIGIAIVDMSAGMYAAMEILAALLMRQRTGKGQYVETTLLDSAASWMSYAAHYYFMIGKTPPKTGSAHFSIVPYQCFETKEEKYITVCCGNEPTWQRLTAALNCRELEKEEFSTNVKRVENRDRLIPILEEIFRSKTRDEWLQTLLKADVPAGPVNDMQELFSDPAIIHRKMLTEIDHPTLGKVKQIGSAMRFSDADFHIKHHPPLLGEHTSEILKTLGFSDSQITKLRENGAI
jgi:crotonobetainyl-CoA:carnitine CoA-transferase CaiB-like acyl-CoA transferase